MRRVKEHPDLAEVMLGPLEMAAHEAPNSLLETFRKQENGENDDCQKNQECLDPEAFGTPKISHKLGQHPDAKEISTGQAPG